MKHLLDYDLAYDRLFWRPISDEAAAGLEALNAAKLRALGFPYKISETPNPYWPICANKEATPWRRATEANLALDKASP
jgi:hypothetical protein